MPRISLPLIDSLFFLALNAHSPEHQIKVLNEASRDVGSTIFQLYGNGGVGRLREEKMVVEEVLAIKKR